MALSSNALCAKAKAMYGYRLNEESYSDLCRKQTLGEMVTYLKSQTKYSGVLEDINVRNVHRRQVEAALNKEYFERCARLMKYAPKKNQDFYSQEVIGIEVQLIVDKVVSIKEKDQASFSLEIPDYLASKMSFNIYGLINVDNYKDLVTYLRDTRYYKILADFDFTAPIDINALERQMKSLFYSTYVAAIKKNFKGKEQKELLEEFMIENFSDLEQFIAKERTLGYKNIEIAKMLKIDIKKIYNANYRIRKKMSKLKLFD